MKFNWLSINYRVNWLSTYIVKPPNVNIAAHFRTVEIISTLYFSQVSIYKKNIKMIQKGSAIMQPVVS